MPITDWPKEDRPREKLLLKGEQSLTDAELLAIFIKTGTRGRTALDIAKELLVEHGGLKRLLQLPPRTLILKNGLGLAKFAALKAAAEMGRRNQHITLLPGDVLSSNLAAQQFLTQRLQGHEIEVFACLYLDTHFRLISFEELFRGTVNEASVYPREIVRRGLHHNAAKVILAHNHPSGQALPSAADKEVTEKIREALGLVDIRVVDHIIIGNPGSYSFAENGLV